MANNVTDQIYFKVGVDTTNFNDSMTGMKKELIALKGLVGNSILSKEDQSAVLGRMTALKDEIADISNATSKVKGLEVIGKTIGPVISGMGTAAGAAKLLGVQWKGLEQTEAIMMTTMNAAMALQQLKDLSELKGMLASKGARLASILTINTETASVGVATTAQWLWNAAVNANPIGLMITAIAAVVAAIGGLIFWYKKHNEVSEDVKKKIKETIEVYKDYNDAIKGITRSYAEEIEKRNLDLKGASDAEKEILTENTNFANKLEEQKTKWLAKEALIRLEINTAIDEKDWDRYHRALASFNTATSLNNTVVAGITRQHNIVIGQINEKGAKDEAKAEDEKNKDIASKGEAARKKKQDKINKEVQDIKEKIQKEIDEEKKKNEEISDLEKRSAAAHQKVRENQTANDNALWDAEIKKWEEVVAAQTKAEEALKKIHDEGKNLSISLNPFPSLMTAALDFYSVMGDENATWQEKLQAGLVLAKEATNLIFDQINQANQASFDSSMESMNKTFEKQYTDLEKLKDSKQLSDAEYQKRKEKLDKEKEAKELALKKEKAKKDKEAAIIQAIVNTALSVTAAMTAGPAGIAMGIIAGALGLVQIALIAAQPLAYKMGGLVGKKFAKGGYLDGPSHAMGGIPIVAEGGEYIIRKNNVTPQTLPILSRINQTGSVAGSNYGQGISSEDMQSIATAVTASIVSIPVNVTETAITKTQRKVTSIETAASW